MERNAKIGIAGVVLAGLCVGVYYQQKKDAALGTTAAKGDLPELKVGEDIDKIDITNGSKGEIVLEKKGDKWELTKPVSAVANQTNVKSLVDNMKDLKLVDQVVGAKPEDYDLQPDKAVHIVAMKGAEKKLDARFGKTGGLGDAFIMEGNPNIFLVKGYSSWMYGREVKDWRDREMFKLDDAQVASFEIDGAHGKFLFTKGDKDGGANDWAGTHDKKAIPSLDGSKVANAVGSFKNLMADDFGEGKSPAETGLDAPEETVIIKMKDGATHTLKVGKAVDKAHYAQKDSDPVVYTIAAYPYEWASAEMSKFQNLATDAGAPDAAKPAAANKDAGKK
jgi:hypothetical protein